MNSAIILAGGIGSRLGAEYPKQFLPINNNQIILDLSINVFKKNPNIHEIILVCHNDWLEKIENKFDNIIIVPGGRSRSDSSLSGLLKCSKNCKNVLIHDAARPYLKQQLINDCLKYLNKYDAAIPVIKCNDSLVKIENNKTKYLNRNQIRLIQTPQAFKYEKILCALKNKKDNYSDDLSILLDSDDDIKYILFDGDINNFKITTNHELKLAKAISNEI